MVEELRRLVWMAGLVIGRGVNGGYLLRGTAQASLGAAYVAEGAKTSRQAELLPKAVALAEKALSDYNRFIELEPQNHLGYCQRGLLYHARWRRSATIRIRASCTKLTMIWRRQSRCPPKSTIPAEAGCATNQILYNVTRRGPEFYLLPLQASLNLPVMAYSPVEQGRLPQSGALSEVAQRHGVTLYQVALAWVLRHPNMMAIPKAADEEHVRQNRAALDLTLTEQDLAELDTQFPAPTRKVPLQML